MPRCSCGAGSPPVSRTDAWLASSPRRGSGRARATRAPCETARPLGSTPPRAGAQVCTTGVPGGALRPAHVPQHPAHSPFARRPHNGGMNRLSRFLGATLSFLIAPLALAQAPAPPAPPQEAVDACTGREAGAACTFQHDGHSVAGSCRAMPGGTTVACAPMNFHLRFGPPPEALEACQGQQEGASCQFTAPRGETIAGVCRSGPRGEPAACAPRDLPPAPGAGGSGG